MASTAALSPPRGGAASLTPRGTAKLAGIFQLLEGATATFGQVYLLNSFIVPGNAAASAERILASESLFQIGFAASLIAVAFHLGRALMMYELLNVVRRDIARFALLVIVVGCAIQAAAAIFYIAPLAILKSTSLGLTTLQLQDLSYLLLRMNGYAFNVYLVFFGLWNLATGYLIYRSEFMPRILGALLMVTGVAWVLNLYPLAAQQLSGFMMAGAAIGEIPLLIWLLTKGVDNDRWSKQAQRSPPDAVGRGMGKDKFHA